MKKSAPPKLDRYLFEKCQYCKSELVNVEKTDKKIIAYFECDTVAKLYLEYMPEKWTESWFRSDDCKYNEAKKL